MCDENKLCKTYKISGGGGMSIAHEYMEKGKYNLDCCITLLYNVNVEFV